MTQQQQDLLDYFQDLSAKDQHSLLRFAEFLATGGITNDSAASVIAVGDSVSGSDQLATDNVIPVPEKIERPEEETVVAALKRMSATYPMLEKKILLNKASELVAQHIMFGKPAVVVINDIEAMFTKAYDKFIEDLGGDK